VATIRILPPELASQIAAGEVVERPASAVKELIENALDAGANRCDVIVEGGGLTRLAVIDDGCGLTEADAELAVQRHATSKLSVFEDLNQVTTFGFRGEALPSIASVSKLRIVSRTRASDAGVEVVIEGGASASVRPIGCAVGTRVDVCELFYNVPARRKFLRSSGTEAGHVTEVVEAAALGRPDVTFTVERDGRRVREWLRVSSREERVRQAAAEDELARCAGERGPLQLEAFLSRPERARTGAGGLRVFVNGRAVRDRAIAATVAQAYGGVLERGKYPRGVVYLDLNPRLVDVNVHPQKAEVRYADPRAVTDAVYGILSRALGSAFALPPSTRPQDARSVGSSPFPRNVPAVRHSASDELPPVETQQDPLALAIIPEPPVLAVRDSGGAGAAATPEAAWSKLRFVAQLRQTYLLCEAADGYYVVDQHAAAERVTFTKLRRQYKSRNVAAQALLFPLLLEVTADEVELVEACSASLLEIGIELRVRGAALVSVHSIPKLLQGAAPEQLVRDLLSEVSRSGRRAFSDAVDLALATMACHGSVRAGDALTTEAATALLEALDGAEFAGHCPHGRPIVSFTSWAELERRVGRR
jgi:DNA mismatch repair protein MutL